MLIRKQRESFTYTIVQGKVTSKIYMMRERYLNNRPLHVITYILSVTISHL